MLGGVKLDYENGVFRRYHAGDNPINFNDPSGFFEVNPSMESTWGNLGSGGLNWLESQADQLAAQPTNPQTLKVLGAMATVSVGAALAPEALGYLLMNPNTIQYVGDFLLGIPEEMGPPPPSAAGYVGAGASALYNYFQNNYLTKNKCK